jgi:hypothetical protein
MTLSSKSLTEHLVRGVLGFITLVVLVVLPSCAPTTRVTVNSRMFMPDGTHLKFEGGGCMTLELGNTIPMEKGDFQFAESEDGDVVLEQVFSDTELLASRRYDVAFLTSAKVDEFGVKTHAGKEYLLRFWGGSCAPLDAGVDGGSGG